MAAHKAEQCLSPKQQQCPKQQLCLSSSKAGTVAGHINATVSSLRSNNAICTISVNWKSVFTPIRINCDCLSSPKAGTVADLKNEAVSFLRSNDAICTIFVKGTAVFAP